VEAEWDAVAAQQVPDLVRAGGPLLPDDPEGLEPGTVPPRPRVQEPADRLMEEKNSSEGPQGLAVQSSTWPRAAARRMDSAAERSPQLISATRCAPGCRPCTRLRKLGPAHGRHPLVSQHQAQLPAVVPELLEPAQPSLRGGGADHLVVGSVALVQLPLDGAERRLVIINGQQHRSGRAHVPSPDAGHAAAGAVRAPERARQMATASTPRPNTTAANQTSPPRMGTRASTRRMPQPTSRPRCRPVRRLEGSQDRPVRCHPSWSTWRWRRPPTPRPQGRHRPAAARNRLMTGTLARVCGWAPHKDPGRLPRS
jgi:hypothetical protein